VTTLGAQIGTDGRIKEGLALVDASGTVNVNNGTYSEWVDINKASVTLKAVSNWGPTIEGYAPTGETVRFTADNVTLQGFQINNQRAQGNHRGRDQEQYLLERLPRYSGAVLWGTEEPHDYR
jgi:hypothetical protein